MTLLTTSLTRAASTGSADVPERPSGSATRAPTTLESIVVVLIASQIFLLPLDFAEVRLTTAGGPDLIRWGLLSLGGLLVVPVIWAIALPRYVLRPSPASLLLVTWLVWAGLGLLTSANMQGTALAVLFMVGNWIGFTWLYQRFGRQQVAAIHILALAAFVAIGLATDLAAGSGGRLDGLSHSLNGFAATAVLLMVWTMIYRRARPANWQYAVMILAATGTLASGSRAAIAAMFFIGLVLGRRKKGAVLVLWASVLLMVVVLAAAGGFIDIERGAEGEDTVATLTGRSEIWSRAVELVRHRPIAGYGMHSGEALWTNEYLRTNVTFQAGNAHNLFLEAAVATGLVGLSLLVAAILLAFADLMRRRDLEFAVLALVVFVALGSTEALIDGASLGFVQVVLICAHARDRPRRRVEQCTPPRTLDA